MLGKLALMKLLLIFSFIIVLIHVLALAVTVLIHVVLLVPMLRKFVMKRSSCCQSH
ncbi:MAG TPA: hypothetical protein VEF35_07930 [Candidatus Bathyarchaeia archaeon]|nr:hypothetical protein [Candidatus Bathyarchaeia archaeon]